MSSKIRIIGGAHKGRRLPVLDEEGLRPTTDRIRESLFNWLQFSIRDKRCLDLFAGTGALGFEALSRGASHVTFIEKNKRVAAQLKSNIELLQFESLTELERMDAMHYLNMTEGTPYDVIFLDPPYHSDLLERALAKLPDCAHLYHDETLLYIEHEKAKSPTVPPGWQAYKSNHTGQISYGLYRQNTEE